MVIDSNEERNGKRINGENKKKGKKKNRFKSENSRTSS